MTETDFAQLEAYLGHPLPSRYRELMRAYPFRSADPNPVIALSDDLPTVVSWNAELRDGEWSAEWSRDRFAIGGSACGDTYFLDLTGTSSAVFLWDHETHEISETAPDLDRFVAARAREDEESRREFAVREQERRREEREWARRAWRIIAIGFFLVIVLPLLLLALLVWVNSQRRGAV
jgi:hypothetical protein